MSYDDYPMHTIVVPHSINMVSLLGPADEHLALIENAFSADIHVRGNQITLRGESAEVALAERLVDELVTILRTGQGLTPETVERAVGIPEGPGAGAPDMRELDLRQWSHGAACPGAAGCEACPPSRSTA